MWVTEVGRSADWQGRGGFAGFVEAVSSAPIEAVPLGADVGSGYDVRFVSPTRGEVTFGWSEPLTVSGDVVPLNGYPRYDHPWARADWDTSHHRIHADGWFVDLDFDKGTRRTGRSSSGVVSARCTPSFG